MSDLISRSALIKVLKDRAINEAIAGYMTAYDVTNSIIDEVDEQPTAYDIGEVVKKFKRNIEVIRNTEYATDTLLNEGIRTIVINKVSDLEEIVKQGGVANNVCEWHKVKNGNAYKCNTHAEIHDSRVLDWCRCPYCGKKIKVVE